MLTDEEIQEIKKQTMAVDRHPRLNQFARAIERAVLAKAGEKEPAGIIGVTDCLNDVVYKLPIGTNLYVEPLPAQAIPEGYEIKIDEDGLVQILDHVSKTSELIRQPIAIRYFTDLLSASPKP